MFHAPIPNAIQKQYSQSLDIYKHTQHNILSIPSLDIIYRICSHTCSPHFDDAHGRVSPSFPAWGCVVRHTGSAHSERRPTKRLNSNNTTHFEWSERWCVLSPSEHSSNPDSDVSGSIFSAESVCFSGCVCVYFCACLFASWNPHMASLNMNSIDLYNATVRVKHGARHDHNGNTPRRHPGRHPGKRCLAYSENNYQGCQHPLAYSVANRCWFALQIGATITESVFCLPVTKCAQLSTLRQSQFIEWTLCNFVVVMCDPKIMYLRLSVSIYSRALEGRGGRHSYEIPHQNTGEFFMPDICMALEQDFKKSNKHS